jgi:hypothetical protein
MTLLAESRDEIARFMSEIRDYDTARQLPLYRAVKA